MASQIDEMTGGILTRIERIMAGAALLEDEVTKLRSECGLVGAILENEFVSREDGSLPAVDIPELLDRLGKQSGSLAAVLRGAKIGRMSVADDLVTIEFEMPAKFYTDIVDSPKSRKIIEDAFVSKLGRPVKIAVRTVR